MGRAAAIAYAREGADVAISYLPDEEADAQEVLKLIRDAGRRAVARRADVRDRDGLAAVVDDAVTELGRLDVVVVNAGISTSQTWDAVTPQLWEATLATNLSGAWYTCQVTAPHLAAAGGGSIILVSSAAGLRGVPLMLPYVVSKHGVVGLMRALANELGPANIRVNSIHPGGVETPMGDGAHRQMAPLLARYPEFTGFFVPALPAGRMQPDDISPTVAYLASDDARFVTGTALPIDAGNANH